MRRMGLAWFALGVVVLLPLACGDEETVGTGGAGTGAAAGTGGVAGSGGAGGTTAGCPPESPSMSCTQEGLSCAYGEECCCGTCYDSQVCNCVNGFWQCAFTNACVTYPPNCGGGGAGGAGGAGGSGNPGGSGGG